MFGGTMILELSHIAKQQWLSGQFPTQVINENEGWSRTVSTLTPTYLVCLFLSMARRQGLASGVVDIVLRRGLDFLAREAYRDPVEGVIVWRFNAYYPPDWEETCWCSALLCEEGLLSKTELDPLRRLLTTNVSRDKGVGVWVKDPYSKTNCQSNVYDPIVSLSVIEWLDRLFSDKCEYTRRFFDSALSESKPSLYYEDDFRRIFYSVLGYGSRFHNRCPSKDFRLFHHGRRTEVWYASEAVWQTIALL